MAWACLTLVQAWIAAGRPKGRYVLGSFQSWADTLGGILDTVGVAGLLGNARELFQRADEESADWRIFFASWSDAHGEMEVAVQDLFELCQQDSLLLAVRGDGKENSQRIRLGRALGKKRDRVIGGFLLTQSSLDSKRRAVYVLREHEAAAAEVVDPRRSANPTSAPTSAGPVVGTTDQMPKSTDVQQDSARTRTRTGEAEGGISSVDFGNPAQTDTPIGGEVHHAEFGTIGEVRHDFGMGGGLVINEEEAHTIAERLAQEPVIGLDLETTGLDPHGTAIRLLSLATANETWVIDLQHVRLDTLTPVLTGGPVKIAHNASFNCRFLMTHGIARPGPWFDTMLAEQILANRTYGQSLADCALEFLDEKMDKRARTSDWSGPLTPSQLEYAHRDAAVLPPLHAALRRALEEANLKTVADVEMRALPAIAWMGVAGMGFKLDDWTALAQEAEGKRDDAVYRLTEITQEALGKTALRDANAPDWNSPAQVLKVIQSLGLDVLDTREETLQSVKDQHPLVLLLLEYREAAKSASTYGTDWLRHVSPVTGRIHADWRQIGAETGRMACRNANLQNLPRNPRYRACFGPGPGSVLVEVDYSQIELRIMAQLSRDPRMLQAFQDGRDLHTLTAATAMQKAEEDVTPDERQMAKAINFGLIYGMGARGLANSARNTYGLDLTEEAAEGFRNRFFAAYVEVRRYHRQHRTGAETRTLWGRRRIMQNKARPTERYNTPVHGTGADLLKLALAYLWETPGPDGAVPVLAIHNELVVEAPAEKAEEARAWVEGAMRRAGADMLTQVPTEVDAEIRETR